MRTSSVSTEAPDKRKHLVITARKGLGDGLAFYFILLFFFFAFYFYF